jgi:serine/threonine protein kinase
MNKAHLMKKITSKGKNAYDSVLEELKILQRLKHPNIIWLHEIIDDPKKDKLYLVTDWYKNGSLKPVKGKNMQPYFVDMLKALHYCHEVAKVVHRDIKPDNIMINHNDEAVLIDFGVSAIVERPEDLILTSNMGSLMFFSPEMFTKAKGIQGDRNDLWALGVTFFYLITGEYPWKNPKNQLELREMVCKSSIDFSAI